MEVSKYREIFQDITQGYSAYFLDKKQVYIRHFHSNERVSMRFAYDEHFAKAKAKGLMTDEDCLNLYEKEGIWTSKDESSISSKQRFLESLYSNKRAISLKSQIDQVNKDISRTEQEIHDLESQKRDIFGVTCESYASSRANDIFLSSILYEDEGLKNRVIQDKDIDDIDSLYYSKIVSINNDYMEKFKEEEVQRLCLEEFYYIYYPFCEDPMSFFGKPIVSLTDNQLKLIAYTRIFKNIFERYDKIPESIKKDPKAILDYGSISDEARTRMNKTVNRDDGSATTLMGATKEDFAYVGLDESDGNVVSLHEEAAKKGGSLDMTDLMKLSGF